jgi:hypothetical protein
VCDVDRCKNENGGCAYGGECRYKGKQYECPLADFSIGGKALEKVRKKLYKRRA